MAAPTQSRILKFGVFEADLEAGELHKSGMRQKLAAQPFQVLKILLDHPQQIVTREELQRRIWPEDTFVDYDLALRKAITRLREVLGDSTESPRFIETIPRRGYRFIAPLNTNGDLSAIAELPTESASQEPTRSSRGMPIRIVAAIGAAVALLTLLGLFLAKLNGRESAARAAPQIRSVAVLPLQNLSNDPTQEYFSEGMTDALITELAQIGSIRVISRTSSEQYKQTKKSLPEIGRELNVDGIIEGTVQRSGDRVRITAQLIHAPLDKHLWANSYERDVRDLLMLEREVAGDIADKVHARLTSERQTQRGQQRPISPAALEAYMQGSSHLRKFWRGAGDEQLDLASQDFRRVIDAEPNFAPAYVALSTARGNTMRSSNEDVEISRWAAERAVEIDPNLPDAWTTLANVRTSFWDWSEAEQDYRRALALNLNDADAHDGLSQILDALGKMDEGWKEAELAQQLDPKEDHLEPALDNRREYDQIIRLMTARLQSDPDNIFLHYGLYEGYIGKGMYKEAFEHLEQTLVLMGFQESAAKLRQAFNSSGYQGAMREWAKEFEYLHANNQVFMPINLADAYTAVGNKDRAFYWLNQACKDRGHVRGVGVVFLNRDPYLEPLRSDPRYKELLRRVSLPP